MSLATLHPRPTAVRSAVEPNRMGAHMQHNELLDLIERVLGAGEHPDITAVERYGPGDGAWGPTVEKSQVKAISGVRVRHESTASAMLWGAIWPGGQPVQAPAQLPPPAQNRAPRLVILTAQLLEVARPAELRSWQLLAFPDRGLEADRGVMPFGLGIETAGGEKMLLLASATGPTVGSEPAEDPYPGYRIPEGVATCLRQANAASAAH